MTIALVANVGIAGNANGGTSSAINTTGATLLVMTAALAVGSAQPVPSDSYSNTWTQIISAVPGSTGYNVMFYVFNPTVGTGHTFTFAGSNIFGATQITAWSGATTLNTPLEPGYVGATGSASTLQPGSITPNQNGSLIITGYSINGVGGSPTVNSSFTISDQETYTGSVNFGAGQAYLVQLTAAAINPTWTFAGSGTNASTIAAFGITPTLTPIEKLSKLVGYSVMAQSDERLSKFVGYAVLAPQAGTLYGEASQTIIEAIGTGTPSAQSAQTIIEAIYPNSPIPNPPRMLRVIARNALEEEANDFDHSYNLQRIIQYKRHVLQPLISNATVNITGVAGTGATGTLLISEQTNLVGVHGTGGVGLAIAGPAPAGVFGTGVAGTVTVTKVTQIGVTGVSGTGIAGTARTSQIYYPVGVAGTGFAGTAIKGGVALGVFGSGQVGSPSLSTSSNPTPAGVHGTGAAGTLKIYRFSSVYGTGIAEEIAGMPFLISGVHGTGEAGNLTVGLGLEGVYGTGEAGLLYILATLKVSDLVRENLLTDATSNLNVSDVAREILATNTPALRVSTMAREILTEDDLNALRVGSVAREILLTGGEIISILLVVT